MSKALGIFFILFGGIFLLEQLGVISGVTLGVIWPILFVALGVWFLFHRSFDIFEPIQKHVKKSIEDSLKDQPTK